MSQQLTQWLYEGAMKAIAGGATTGILNWAFKKRGEGDKPKNSQQTIDDIYSKIAPELSPPSWKILEEMKRDEVHDARMIRMLYGSDSVTEPLKHEFRYRLKYLKLLGLVTEASGSEEYTCTNLGIEVLNERDKRIAAVRGI